jgi:uncharacterized protein (DUF362 family)
MSGEPRGSSGRVSRRAAVLAGSAALAGVGAAALLSRGAEDRGLRAATFVAAVPSYEGPGLDRAVRDALAATGFDRDRVAGKAVVLKPNLVEPTRASPHINTHPQVVRAVAEAFRRLGAREVVVAEGAGHCRDSRWVLDESGVGEVLDALGLPFVDLNYDETETVPNRLGRTGLAAFELPRTVTRRAEILVSLPKAKTHHWAGVTLAMKNLFGVVPGVRYGWPKNVLHQRGIPQSILDLTATVRPHLAIVDGVVGMEGDGPIMGTPRDLGVIVAGTNLPAVDATTARLMDVDPRLIAYLEGAAGVLGPIAAAHIEQRGEALAARVRRFAPLDHPAFPRLR